MLESLHIKSIYKGYTFKKQHTRIFSTSLTLQPLVKADRLVTVSPYVTVLPPLPYLPRRLQGVLLPFGMGNLIFRGASRLDAFSVYPSRLGYSAMHLAVTDATPAVRPSRSRTKDSSSQISYAHAG